MWGGVWKGGCGEVGVDVGCGCCEGGCRCREVGVVRWVWLWLW